ncbi:hypothetical protein KCP73_08350 [Salmonella enterica subsp. enterica]|nr:hypothetical protein KCP73_08350 [Salmonella enterica subsp. enterica]
MRFVRPKSPADIMGGDAGLRARSLPAWPAARQHAQGTVRLALNTSLGVPLRFHRGEQGIPVTCFFRYTAINFKN